MTQETLVQEIANAHIGYYLRTAMKEEMESLHPMFGRLRNKIKRASKIGEKKLKQRAAIEAQKNELHDLCSTIYAKPEEIADVENIRKRRIKDVSHVYAAMGYVWGNGIELCEEEPRCLGPSDLYVYYKTLLDSGTYTGNPRYLERLFDVSRTLCKN